MPCRFDFPPLALLSGARLFRRLSPCHFRFPPLALLLGSGFRRRGLLLGFLRIGIGSFISNTEHLIAHKNDHSKAQPRQGQIAEQGHYGLLFGGLVDIAGLLGLLNLLEGLRLCGYAGKIDARRHLRSGQRYNGTRCAPGRRYLPRLDDAHAEVLALGRVGLIKGGQRPYDVLVVGCVGQAGLDHHPGFFTVSDLSAHRSFLKRCIKLKTSV